MSHLYSCYDYSASGSASPAFRSYLPAVGASCTITLIGSIRWSFYATMDNRTATNRPAAPAPMPVPGSRGGTSGTGSGWLNKVMAVAVTLAALAALVFFASRVLVAMTADSPIKGKQFQAVFLTNGQVYFGKVSKVDHSYVKLTNIYYLQVQQTVQPEDKSKTNQQPQVSLAKLGGELHGPEDVMYISRQQVLFWENLKDDGKVAKAIKDYSASGNK